MAKGPAPGGPIEAITRRYKDTDQTITAGRLVACLTALDNYYRERLDGYGQRITELEDKVRRNG